MAQMTGTSILSLARLFAQDTSTTQPAVSDPNGLLLLNDVLLRWTGDVKARHALIPASSSGLTFAANEAVKETSAQDLWDTIQAAYPSDSSSVPTVLPAELRNITVEEMLNLYDNDGSGTVTGSGTREWQAWAWERVAGADAVTGSTAIRVYVWPALAATRYLTLRVPKNVILAALTDTPDLTQREARTVARLLAWEMGRLHVRDTEFLQQILAPVPTEVLNKYFEGAKTHGWMQAAIRDDGRLGG